MSNRLEQPGQPIIRATGFSVRGSYRLKRTDIHAGEDIIIGTEEVGAGVKSTSDRLPQNPLLAWGDTGQAARTPNQGRPETLYCPEVWGGP